MIHQVKDINLHNEGDISTILGQGVLSFWKYLGPKSVTLPLSKNASIDGVQQRRLSFQ